MIVDAGLWLFFFFGAICFYFGLVSLAYYPLALAYPFWERRLLARARRADFTPTVTVLVPAFNEERTIALSLRSILASDYPAFDVIVIDDGSTDATAAAVAPFLADARLRYIRKTNGGKASALNLGLAEAGGEIVLFTDADSLFDRDTLRNGVAYFVDPTVGAVSGNDTVLAPHGPMQKMLVVTSHIGTGFVRRALSMLGVLQIISGNLGLVRTATLRAIGGFREIWGEDLEVTLRLKRHGVRVVYGAATRVLAECPSTLAGLWKQRVRWLRSYIKILRLHGDMIGRPRYGAFGPFLAFNAFNMIVVPLLQVTGMLLLPLAAAAGVFFLRGWEWIAYTGIGFLFAAATVSILLDRSPRDMLYLPYALLLLVFSHFYNAIVIYSLWAEWRAHAEHWNKLERRGLSVPVTSRWVGFAAALVVMIMAGGAVGYWLGARDTAETVPAAAQSPLPQAGTTAVAVHFDAWRDWRDAYRVLLATPEARYVNRVAVSAGRADWTYFRWPGQENWWSPEQQRADADMLEDAVAALTQRGYGVTAMLDAFAARYIEHHPEVAATDYEGNRHPEIVCSTELAAGKAGEHLVQATQALAAHTHADTVAITELFYDKHCYDDRCLLAFRAATGQPDWPRTRRGAIDVLHPAIGAWRSQQVAGLVAKLARAAHDHGKRFALDVKVSRTDVAHNSVENGQDYRLLAPLVDELVVWNYFAIEDHEPEIATRIAAYLDDEFGADRFQLSLGLWDRRGFISADEFARALRAAYLGGATKLWITPGKELTQKHWRALADAVRAVNPGIDAVPATSPASAGTGRP